MLIGVGIVAIGAWWWVHHKSNPPPLPAEAEVEGMAPRERDAESPISAKADSSEWARRLTRWESTDDVELVTRTFKEANDCLLYHSARHELNAVLNDERLSDLSNETLATLENLDTTSSRYLSIVRQTEDFCIGSNRQALAQVYANAILKAALLDSADAKNCFVTSNVSPLETTAAVSHAFYENRYLKYAPSFTKSALERLDPYVAEHVLNRYIASPGVHPSRLDDMQKADPYLTWQMARLASLRALPEQRIRLEEKLALFEGQNLLDVDDIKRADAWAEATYEREFAGQEPVDLDKHVPCYSAPDLAP